MKPLIPKAHRGAMPTVRFLRKLPRQKSSNLEHSRARKDVDKPEYPYEDVSVVLK